MWLWTSRMQGAAAVHSYCFTTTRTTTTTTSSTTTSSSSGAPLRASFSGRRVLFLGAYWPDRRATGAGVRTTSLLDAFVNRWGYDKAVFASPARENDASRALASEYQKLETTKFDMNRKDQLEEILVRERPDVVVFDRFPAEEAYSWVVRSVAPEALRVLDMQDSHALRLWRQKGIEGGKVSLSQEYACSFTPEASFKELQRELASIHRSDLALVCSPTEKDMLSNVWGIKESKLCEASFFMEKPDKQRVKPFAERNGFVTVGTFLHPPNVDSIKWLAQEIWPLVRRKNSRARIDIYGAHLERVTHLQRLHNPDQGFHVNGFAESLEDALGNARVLLSPLRFGAGIKTKILDAFSFGTPVATTPIGAEGIATGSRLDSPSCDGSSLLSWGGMRGACTAAEVAEDALRLHEDEALWQEASANGMDILSNHFNKDANLQVVHEALQDKLMSLGESRETDFTGQAFWHGSLRATEYFSRWVELKEKSNNL